MSEPDEIESKIQERLQSVARNAQGQNWPDPQWTREVKNALATLGRESDCDVWAASCDVEVRGGEWLFDLVWLKYCDHRLVGVPLVVESEWNPAGVYDDFEKLLVVRAEHRLLIFSAKTRTRAAERFVDLEQRVGQFEFTASGDRYLFSCWTNDTAIFVFRVFVA